MSNFNDANELASNLVFGTHYYSDKPMEGPRPEQMSFHLTQRVVLTADAETHEEWVKIAGWIEELINEGFWLDTPAHTCGVSADDDDEYSCEGCLRQEREERMADRLAPK